MVGEHRVTDRTIEDEALSLTVMSDEKEQMMRASNDCMSMQVFALSRTIDYFKLQKDEAL